ncbi:cupin domain-containing protein [Lichenifustis flavocetrariae]|uniref:Cupin domain-containing protein n=1 Tax=Lichenifustis flavocetrariae TaxID=2949735 RepID=A0AA41Z9X7_9HYPH|nr:cupin domain-containing protein [Lichenifustis flavocetrariae]MCW6511982.1 cupin domain-containing protein [Lichenifustis flavocetrariae]
MSINDDLTKPVLVHASRNDWIPSPAPGVDRRMLFRIGEEKARATSIVRYAPGSSFAEHVHTGGEEFLVLEGVFQDGDGDYPAGTYVRNPPGTAHAPAAERGTTIFVRLWQFRAEDRTQIVRRPGEGACVTPRSGGGSAIILFQDEHEEVRLEEWPAGSCLTVENGNGLEYLLVAGSLTANGDAIAPLDWGRLPGGIDFEVRVGEQGATVWMKFGPLLHGTVCERSKVD